MRASTGVFQKIGWPTAPPQGMMPPNPSNPTQPVQPPAPPPNSVAFFAIADWGGQDDWPMTTVAQLQCAQAMSKIATDLVHPTFVVSAGDNFYELGIKGARPAAGAWARGPPGRQGTLSIFIAPRRPGGRVGSPEPVRDHLVRPRGPAACAHGACAVALSIHRKTKGLIPPSSRR